MSRITTFLFCCSLFCVTKGFNVLEGLGRPGTSIRAYYINKADSSINFQEFTIQELMNANCDTIRSESILSVEVDKASNKRHFTSDFRYGFKYLNRYFADTNIHVLMIVMDYRPSLEGFVDRDSSFFQLDRSRVLRKDIIKKEVPIPTDLEKYHTILNYRNQGKYKCVTFKAPFPFTNIRKKLKDKYKIPIAIDTIECTKRLLNFQLATTSHLSKPGLQKSRAASSLTESNSNSKSKKLITPRNIVFIALLGGTIWVLVDIYQNVYFFRKEDED